MTQDPLWRLLCEPGVAVVLALIAAYAWIVFTDWMHDTRRLP